MKYSVSEAARIVGFTRKTFYKHIKKKGISVEKDENNRPLIDASELIRVYGDRCNFETDQENTKVDEGQGTPQKVDTDKQLDTVVEIAVLREKLSNTEEQRDHYQTLYEQERQERQANTRLLADQRDKQDHWEKSFLELQQMITNQESKANQELETFKQQTKRQLIAYKRALQQERNKSLWQRLFGNTSK